MKLYEAIGRHMAAVTSFRRKMHENPDLSEHENRTCRMITEVFSGAGIEHQTLLGGTAVCALVRGRDQSRSAALRADIDALPLTEKTGLAFASRNGAMHACGHDLHAACALGAALVLKRSAGELPCAVKIFFQPAEETVGGAQRMIEAGVLEAPHVTHVLGLHVNPFAEAGRAVFKRGRMNAASDEFTVVMHGRGCHGAHPQEGCDAIAMAAQFVTALQQVVSRNVSPLDAAVVTIGKIEGGVRGNVIADRVELTGILRSFEDTTRQLLRRRAAETARGCAAAFGGTAEFILRPSYPSLVNDAATVDKVAAAACKAIGAPQVAVDEVPSLGTEDFAYFARERPSCFYELGCGFAGGDNHPLHSAEFLANEDCLPVGVKLHVAGLLALAG